MSRFRSLVLVGAAIGVVLATVRSKRRAKPTSAVPTPQITPHSAAPDRTGPASPDVSRTSEPSALEAVPEPTISDTPVADTAGPRPSGAGTEVSAPDDMSAEPAPTEPGPRESVSSEPGPPTKAWRETETGECPPGFPVKVKLASGIFHVPGGLSYDRTKPDRCYPDSASAAADGFRAAKR